MIYDQVGLIAHDQCRLPDTTLEQDIQLARQQTPPTKLEQALRPAIRIEFSQAVSATGRENNSVHL